MLVDGRMPLRDLAPALLSLAEHQYQMIRFAPRTSAGLRIAPLPEVLATDPAEPEWRWEGYLGSTALTLLVGRRGREAFPAAGFTGPEAATLALEWWRSALGEEE